MRWILVAAGASIGAAAGRDAGAQTQGMAIVYRAPESCPADSDFAGRVSARLRGAGAMDPMRRSIQVVIVQTPAGYAGTVSFSGAGRRAEKRLMAPSCSELADALAFAAALALRTDEPAPRVEEQRPMTQGDATTHPSATSDTPERATERPPEPPSKPTRAEPTVGITSSPTASAGGAGSTSLGVEVGALVAVGPAPATIVAGLLGVDWVMPTGGPWELALGLGAAGGAAPDVNESGGVASFAWFVGRVTACVLKLSLGPRVRARACALADGGVEVARGSETNAGATSSRGWLSPGAGVRVEVPLAERWVVLAGAGAELPLRRDLYAFGSNGFFEVPTVIGTATLSVGFFSR